MQPDLPSTKTTPIPTLEETLLLAEQRSTVPRHRLALCALQQLPESTELEMKQAVLLRGLFMPPESFRALGYTNRTLQAVSWSKASNEIYSPLNLTRTIIERGDLDTAQVLYAHMKAQLLPELSETTKNAFELDDSGLKSRRQSCSLAIPLLRDFLQENGVAVQGGQGRSDL